MRKISPYTSCFIRTITLLILMTTLFLGTISAQNVLAKWPLNSKAVPVPTTPLSATNVASGVVTNGMTYNANTFGNTSPNNTGLKLKSINNYVWPTFPSPSVTTDPDFSVNFPISPAVNSDLIITGLTMIIATPNLNSTTLAVLPYYQIDGMGSWISFGTQQTFAGSSNINVNFGTLNQPFFSKSADGKVHSYVVKLCFYSTTPLVVAKGDYFYLTQVIFNGTVQTATTPPLVTTIQPNASGKYAGVGTGSYSFGATIQVPSVSGVTWNTVTNPVVGTSPSTTDGNNTGSINPSALSNITGLTPNTLYHVRAYAITPLDTIYGNDLTFTTDNFSTPVVVTKTPSNVLSNKATSGGDGTIKNNVGATLIDTGGYSLTEKGIYYGTTNPPTTKLKYVNPIFGTSSSTSDPFDIVIKSLTPSTKYYVQAYAINKLGQGLGIVQSFTTLAPVPTLTATPSVIDFGDIVYDNTNKSAPVISYSLTGANLTPDAGLITITFKATTVKGFVISSSATTFPATPVTSITIPYSGGKLKKTIYVKMLTASYGSFAYTVGHSGGGVSDPQNADSVSLIGNVIPSPDQLSNTGSDFWTGFAYHNAMKKVTTQFDTTLNGSGAHFSVFLAGGTQGDSVVVELPGIPNAVSFPRTVYVPAGGFVEVGGFPVGDGLTEFNATHAPDARLYFTGVSNRGIHIYSKNGVPVSSWIYDWETGDAAGGAMLFPTNTWNSSYIVQAVGGKANNNGASGYNNNSFFFVIAKDDNTIVTFKPTNDIIDSNANTLFKNMHLHTPAYVKYKKDTTYSITLNKGQVFNAMGFVGNPDPAVTTDPGALDLSGTVVSTTCDKKIAVFGGNGRCVIGTTGDNPQVNNQPACLNPYVGSDNLIQQMFPKVAWGTEYLTVPTKNMADNMFRVYVQDQTTNVTLNGVLLSKANLVNNLYYQFDINRPSNISADKPVSVTQFILSGACSGGSYGNVGNGDPEMITLSPVQQSIKSATVYSATFKDQKVGACYINVVVKDTAGVNSFKLDGLQSGIDTGGNSFIGAAYAHSGLVTMKNAFKKHPGDGNYYYATFWVKAPAKHTLSSTQGFNAIAYGVNGGESYGYNAGTAINNLSSVKIAQNPNGNDTSSSVIKTCKDNPVTLQIALPYLPSQVDSIVWTTPNNPNINRIGSVDRGAIMTDPNNSTKQYADTSGLIVAGGQTFYMYTCPVQYQFSDFGFYPIIATAYGKFASDCGGTDAQKIYVQVSADNIDFKVNQIGGCISSKLEIKDSSTAMVGASIVKWIWDLGNNSPIQTYTDPLNHNPTPNPYDFTDLKAYTIKLTTINNLGCFSRDTVYMNLAFSVSTKFTKDKDTACLNTPVSFTDSSSATATSWNWDFGEPGSANNIVTYTTPTNPTHTYTTPGKHIIKVQAFTASMCPSLVFTDSVYISSIPVANFTYGGVCLPGNTSFTNTSDSATGFAPYIYLWNFGDSTNGIPNTSSVGTHTYQAASTDPKGFEVILLATNRFGCVAADTNYVNKVYGKPIADFSIVKSDVCLGATANFLDNNQSTVDNTQAITKWHWAFGDGKDTTTAATGSSHIYSTMGTDSVKLVVETDKGCMSDSSKGHAIIIHPLPIPSFVLPGSCLGSGSVTFTNTSTIISAEPMSYSWTFGDPNNAPNNSTATDGVHSFKDSGTYSIVLTPSTAFGCSATSTQLFNIAGTQPIPSFTIANRNGLCSNVPVSITDISRVAVGVIKKVEIYWNYTASSIAPDTTDRNPSNGSAASSKTYNHVYPISLSDQTYNIRLVAYSGSTCSHDTTISVIVHGIPKPSFVLPGSCLGSGSVVFTNTSTTLSGGALSSSWTFGDVNNPPNLSTATDGIHAFKDTGTFAVILTSTTTFGCSVSDTAQFNVAGSQPIPSFVVSTPSGLCANLPVTITDNSRIAVGVIKKVELYWNYLPGATTPDYVDNSPSNGLAGSSKQYTHQYPASSTDKSYKIRLVAYSGSTCDHDTIIGVTVHGSPKVSFANQPNICASAAPIAFTQAIENTGSFVGNGGFTYTGLGVNNTTLTFDPSKVTGGTTSSIIATYTSSYGCKESATSNVNVLASVDLSFNPNKLSLCKTDSIQLKPISNVGQAFAWTESVGSNTLVNAAIKSPWVTPTKDSTVYTVVATNPSYCTSTASVTVHASPYPQVKITSPANRMTTVCYNVNTTLKANTTSPNIVWSPKDSLPLGYASATVTTNVLDTTQFVVKVSDNSYCAKSVTDTVILNVLPNFTVSARVGADTSTEVVPNESIQLYAFLTDTSQHFPVKYDWSGVTGHFVTGYLSRTDIADPIFKAGLPLLTDSVIYKVRATTLQGCQADTNFVIRLFYKPDLLVASAFLPNSGLEKNRTLVVNPVGITHFGYFKVYNRSGQQIFSTTEIGKGWDGTFNGLPADNGTYVWIAAGTDYQNRPHTQTGTVVLIR